MRVIAGKYKRRNLKAVPGKSTRPTTDRNKENMFNLIGPYFTGGRCLDLFAGSGALGIEALSRGMDELYSVDLNFQAYQTIKENLVSLHLEAPDVHLYKMSCFKALSLFKEKGLTFDLVLLDPPYGKGFIPKVLDILTVNEMLNSGAVVVAEEKSEVVLAQTWNDLVKVKEVNYGVTTLHLYHREEKIQ